MPFGMFVRLNAGGVEEHGEVPSQVKFTPSDPAKAKVGKAKPIASKGALRRHAISFTFTSWGKGSRARYLFTGGRAGAPEAGGRDPMPCGGAQASLIAFDLLPLDGDDLRRVRWRRDERR